MSSSAKKNKEKATGVIASNRKARRDYVILEKIEAGIALLGPEVKSIRTSKVDLTAGFASLENGEVTLRDVHIKAYEYSHQFTHEPTRPRRLLLHKREINKLSGKLTQKGLTLIPLSLYFNQRGKVKVELGLCKGKQMADKRETLRRKTADREAERAIASHVRRRYR